MIGERVVVIGRTKRRRDPVVRSTSLAMPSGSAAAAATADGAPRINRLPVWVTDSRSWPRVSARSTSGPWRTARGAGGRSYSTGSRSRSTTWLAIWMPPMPSVRAWWTLITRAACPSGRPSTTVISQSGRSWSNAAMPAVRAIWRTVARSPPSGTRT